MLNRKLASRIFNSELKRKQRLWASRQPEFMKAQILKNEVQERIFDCVKVLK